MGNVGGKQEWGVPNKSETLHVGRIDLILAKKKGRIDLGEHFMLDVVLTQLKQLSSRYQSRSPISK